jgi:hypothetical protein
VQPARKKGRLVESFDKLLRIKCASSMSRRSAASRSGNSATDGFGLFQDRTAADEIPACLNRLALDEIDGPAKKPLQPVLHIGERRKIVSGSGLEGNEESASLRSGSNPMPRAEPKTSSRATP